MLKSDLCGFVDWFSRAFHEPGGNAEEDLADAVIQTLALANMAMLEHLSLNYRRRVSVSELLKPVIEQTLTHDEAQKNCRHKQVITDENSNAESASMEK